MWMYPTFFCWKKFRNLLVCLKIKTLVFIFPIGNALTFFFILWGFFSEYFFWSEKAKKLFLEKFWARSGRTFFTYEEKKKRLFFSFLPTHKFGLALKSHLSFVFVSLFLKKQIANFKPCCLLTTYEVFLLQGLDCFVFFLYCESVTSVSSKRFFLFLFVTTSLTFIFRSSFE